MDEPLLTVVPASRDRFRDAGKHRLGHFGESVTRNLTHRHLT